MNDFATYLEKVDAECGTEGRRFFDAAVPPDVYADIVHRIGEAGLQKDAKIVLEKPFGRDLQSALELNEVIHSVFDESQVFRIDHYLGKETVQNILAFRFANGMFEPIWNRRYIDHVQITVAEDDRDRGARGLLRADRQHPRHDLDAPVPGDDVRRDGAARVVRTRPAPRRDREGAPLRATWPTSIASSGASTSATATSRASRPTRRPRPSP